MDRQHYLSLCQKCSTIPKGLHEAKTNIPAELLVKYDEINFYPLGYKITFDNGKTRHTAIWGSLRGNYIVECGLQKVEGVQNEEKEHV